MTPKAEPGDQRSYVAAVRFVREFGARIVLDRRGQLAVQGEHWLDMSAGFYDVLRTLGLEGMRVMPGGA
jgi:hypothetical protein